MSLLICITPIFLIIIYIFTRIYIFNQKHLLQNIELNVFLKSLLIILEFNYFFSYPLFRSSSNTPISYVLGSGGIGLPLIRHHQLSFTPTNFFALGSPISMFLTVRGVENLGEDFVLPTCPGFFNIFHPVSINWLSSFYIFMHLPDSNECQLLINLYYKEISDFLLQVKLFIRWK